MPYCVHCPSGVSSNSGASPCPGFFSGSDMSDMAKRNDEIVRRYKRGDTLQSIGDAFGLSRWRVYRIAVDERSLPARGRGFRSIPRDTIISGMKHVNDGLTFKQAAARIGISAGALYGKAVAFGLHEATSVDRSPWTDVEVRTVSNLYRKVPASKIAEKLGRTRNEVIGKASRLGL